MEYLTQYADISINFLAAYRVQVGWITLIISIVGAALMVCMQRLLRNSTKKLGKRLHNMYRYDALRFVITAIFGLAGVINAEDWFWHLAYIIRPIILILLVWAAFKLVMCYLEIAHMIVEEEER
jgi:hypothetical protein